MAEKVETNEIEHIDVQSNQNDASEEDHTLILSETSTQVESEIKKASETDDGQTDESKSVQIERPETENEELKIGVALRGILTINGRQAPSSWVCGVCEHQERENRDRCSECKCQRIAEWMYNEESELIQPGMIVEVNCAWQPVKWTTNSKCGSKVRLEPVVAIVTDLCRMKKSVEVCVLWNPMYVSGQSSFLSGELYEPVLATINPVECGKRLCLPLKLFCDDPDQGGFVISPAPYFAKFGICGNKVCGGIYNIVDGDLYGCEDEVKQLEAQILSETNEAARLRVLKAQYKKTQDFANVTQTNEDINQAEARARAARWRTAPKQTWCPYCTWQQPY